MPTVTGTSHSSCPTAKTAILSQYKRASYVTQHIFLLSKGGKCIGHGHVMGGRCYACDHMYECKISAARVATSHTLLHVQVGDATRATSEALSVRGFSPSLSRFPAKMYLWRFIFSTQGLVATFMHIHFIAWSLHNCSK